MNAFAFEVSFDDQPITHDALLVLANALKGRHGSVVSVEQHGNVAALLLPLIGAESKSLRKPLVRDGMTIVSDARLDDRETLLRNLTSAGALVSDESSDDELLLAAYETWGEACVERLLGDFSFALSDARESKLFVARDPMGVRPLYWSKSSDRSVVVSNVMDVCSDRLPERRIDDEAALDFLLFGYQTDVERTIWRDVHRVPPGHTMCWRGEQATTRRFFTFPLDAHASLRSEAEIVEEFRERFTKAVRDRTRGVRAVAISMSGGLDSTSIAAVAKQNVEPSQTLFASSVVFTRFADQELDWSARAARLIGIPSEGYVADDVRPFDGWSESPRPVPCDEPLYLILLNQLRSISEKADVVLTGQGSDPLHYASHSHYWQLLKRGRLVRFVMDATKHYRRFGTKPPLLLRSRLRRLFGSSRVPAFPTWIRPEVEREFRLREKWNAHHGSWSSPHPTRPEAHQLLTSPAWPHMFEYFHPGASGVRVELRHPFMDLRLLTFALSLPPYPWFTDKYLLREAMKGVLPEEIRTRPKTPLQGDPLTTIPELRSILQSRSSNLALVERWADPQMLERELEMDPEWNQLVVPFCLAEWSSRLLEPRRR